MHYPKISIITPSYNQGQYIEETILSIINQGYPDLEYIIIDGGSTDNTVDIIKKYEKHIAYWVSEPDNGQSDAINKGIAVATGDVFNWINSDDMLLPGSLELVGKHFKNNNLRLLCTPIKLLHPNQSISINNATKYTKSIYEILNSNGLNQQGMFWKMKYIKDLNGVNPNFNYSMDLDLWKRFVINYGINFIETNNFPTAIFRLYEDSKTGGDFIVNFNIFEGENNAALCQYANPIGKKYIKGIRQIKNNINENIALLEPHSKLNNEVIKQWLNKLFYNETQRHFFKNSFKKAYYISKCIDLKYLNIEEKRNVLSYKKWSFFKRFIYA